MLRCSIQRMKRFSPNSQRYPDPSMPPESGTEDAKDLQINDGSKRVKTTQSFESLFDSETLSDVTLNVNDGQCVFNGHKMIIGMKSDVLASLLNEASSVETEEKPVLFLHESVDCTNVFSRFLYFLYSGAVWLHRDYVIPLHKLAEKYAVKSLTYHCESYIAQILSNMVGVYENIRGFPVEVVCDIYEGNCYTEEIHHLAFKVLCAKFKELVKSDRWSKCPWNLVCDLLKCDDCFAEENFILTSATDWMKKNSLSDKSLIEDILINIRYPLLHKRVLYHLKKNSAFKNFPQVQNLLEQAMQYHCFKDLPEAKEDFKGIYFTPRNQPNTLHIRAHSTDDIRNQHLTHSDNHDRHRSNHILNHSVLVQNNQPVNYGVITTQIIQRSTAVQALNVEPVHHVHAPNITSHQTAVSSNGSNAEVTSDHTVLTSGGESMVTTDILHDLDTSSCHMNNSRIKVPSKMKKSGFRL